MTRTSRFIDPSDGLPTKEHLQRELRKAAGSQRTLRKQKKMLLASIGLMFEFIDTHFSISGNEAIFQFREDTDVGPALQQALGITSEAVRICTQGPARARPAR
jgi:hypothetical protein